MKYLFLLSFLFFYLLGLSQDITDPRTKEHKELVRQLGLVLTPLKVCYNLPTNCKIESETNFNRFIESHKDFMAVYPAVIDLADFYLKAQRTDIIGNREKAKISLDAAYSKLCDLWNNPLGEEIQSTLFKIKENYRTFGLDTVKLGSMYEGDRIKNKLKFGHPSCSIITIPSHGTINHDHSTIQRKLNSIDSLITAFDKNKTLLAKFSCIKMTLDSAISKMSDYSEKYNSLLDVLTDPDHDDNKLLSETDELQKEIHNVKIPLSPDYIHKQILAEKNELLRRIKEKEDLMQTFDGRKYNISSFSAIQTQLNLFKSKLNDLNTPPHNHNDQNATLKEIHDKLDALFINPIPKVVEVDIIPESVSPLMMLKNKMNNNLIKLDPEIGCYIDVTRINESDAKFIHGLNKFCSEYKISLYDNSGTTELHFGGENYILNNKTYERAYNSFGDIILKLFSQYGKSPYYRLIMQGGADKSDMLEHLLIPPYNTIKFQNIPLINIVQSVKIINGVSHIEYTPQNTLFSIGLKYDNPELPDLRAMFVKYTFETYDSEIKKYGLFENFLIIKGYVHPDSDTRNRKCTITLLVDWEALEKGQEASRFIDFDVTKMEEMSKVVENEEMPKLVPKIPKNLDCPNSEFSVKINSTKPIMVFEHPELDAQKIGSLTTDTKIVYLTYMDDTENGGWYRVCYNGKKGWIKTSEVSLISNK